MISTEHPVLTGVPPTISPPRWWWVRAVRVMGRVQRLLYAARLGWLFGHSMAIVVHRGRRSGKEYSTALFVKQYDASRRETALVSAFGVTDWYRNVRDGGIVLLEIGHERYRPTVRLLAPAEVAALERSFRRRHPMVARCQAWLMRWPARQTDAEFDAWASTLRGVMLRAQD